MPSADLERPLAVVALLFGFVAAAALARFGPPAKPWDRVGPVVAATVAALVAALWTGAAPTGWLPTDVLLRAALAGGVALAAGRVRRFPIAWAAGSLCVMLLFATSGLELAGTAAAGAVAALLATSTRDRSVETLAGGLIAVAALDLHWDVFTGAPSLVATAIVAPLLVAGFATTDGRFRRRAGFAAAAAAAVCVIGGTTALAAAALAKSSVDSGVRSAREGLASVDRDDRDAAAAELRLAAAEFDDAHGDLRAPWVRLAYVVPFVAQQVRAVDTLAVSGADLARTATRALTIVDPQTIRPEGGQIDLAAVRSLQDPLSDADAALRRSRDRLRDVDSPWLLTPVATRHDELRGRVDRASGQAALAARASRLAPGLLGGDGPRRYLLAVYTPSESRAGGGFMGNYGELTAVDGKVTLSRFGRIRDLEQGGADPSGRTIRGQRDYLANWGDFDTARWWGVINLTNDFPTAAEVMRQLYPQSGGVDVDGVVAIDPDAFVAFLKVTGPISVPGIAQELTAENAHQVLLHDQYLLPESERVDFLGEASRLLFERLTTGSLPGIAALARELAPAVDGRHLQLESARAPEQALFRGIGATGAVPAVRKDSIGVTGQNFNGNKIDWYLRREASYEAVWDPGTGAVKSTLEVVLRNDAPATGEPHAVIGWGGDAILGQAEVADGENLMLLTVYSALAPTSITVDGQPRETNASREHGRHSTRMYVRVPSKGAVTVRVQLEGAIAPGATYELDTLLQPMVNPDHVRARLTLDGSWRLAGGSKIASADWTMTESHTLRARACRTDGNPFVRFRQSC